MFVNYILLLAGFILLIKGADMFVTHAANIAACLHVAPLIIGLTIVAFGTSAPETAVSITAALEGSNAIAVGNVVGSNIFNLLVVLGASALVMPLQIQPSILKRDLPATVGFSVLLMVLTFGWQWFGGSDGDVGRTEGAVLLLLMVLFTIGLIRSAGKNRTSSSNEALTASPKHFLLKNIWLLLLGMAVIVLGGKLVVYAATELAVAWGWSERVIGLTIVAMGTSLPELCTSVMAAFKGEKDLAIGNVLGSNIINIGFVLGISALISPISVESSVRIDSLWMVGSIVLFAGYVYLFRRVGRITGGLLVVGYAFYLMQLL